jgi:predicted O-methyltransferase YrrM
MRESAKTLASELTVEELAKLIAAMRAARLSGWHLEIGTAAGGTLREMMRAYPAVNRPHFVVVDPMTYFADQLATVRRNLALAELDPDEVECRVSKSWLAFRAAARANERYALIFIDGSHKLHHVTEDLSWTRLLQPGGLLCLHDYTPRMHGVVAAVDRFLRQHPNYRIMDRAGSLLVIVKTAESASPEIGSWDRRRAQLINAVHQLQLAAKKRLTWS